MTIERTASDAEPNRSAMLVAACRLLAADHTGEGLGAARLCRDPYAYIFVDDDAIAAARADPALQNVIWLRTHYIDEAVRSFARAHPQCQVVLLGAGLDARALRLGLDAAFFEVDFPATLAAKNHRLATAGVASNPQRCCVAVDLARERFVEPLRAAGLVPETATIVVVEGVTMYLTETEADALTAQLPDVIAPGGVFVTDYVRRASFDRGFNEQTVGNEQMLRSGGDILRHGFADIHASLDAAGFDVVDDEAIEKLTPRYGLAAPTTRVYPSRMLTARRRPG